MNTQADSAHALGKSLEPRIERGVIQPASYVPLAPRPTEGRPHPPGKPWIARKPGETPAAHVSRLFHTCYFCGRFERDMKALDQHEWECSGEGGT